MAAPIRSLYECTYCSRVTARCQGCTAAFSRSHADWCDILCAVCSGVLESWGALPKIDGKARIRRWCSGCMRFCVHDLEQHRLLRGSKYRCTNCQQFTVPCSTCKEGTSLAGQCGIFNVRSSVLEVGSNDGVAAHGERGTTNQQQCSACASGRAWTELHRRRREYEETHTPSRPHHALLHEEHEKLLSRLERFSAFRVCGKNEILIQQGAADRILMVVMRGAVRVEKRVATANGRRPKTLTLATLGPGEIFGDLAFLGGGVANATVRSMHDQVSIMVLPSSDVLDLHLLEVQPPATGIRAEGDNVLVDFYRFLAVHLTERLRTITTKTTTMAFSLSDCDSAAVAQASVERVHFASSNCPASVVERVPEDLCKVFNVNASEYITVQEQCAALVHHGKRPLWGQVVKSYFESLDV